MPDFEIEKSLSGLIAGVDEAGRGPWAGPVVAGAVVFFDGKVCDELAKGLDDSKKLTAKKREALYEVILREAEAGRLTYGIGQASAREIDEINILQATFLAMKRAKESLKIMPNVAIVDGNHCPKDFGCSTKAVIKGDGKSLSIAAASIVAKVYRDRLMSELAKKYPHYGFEKNAGYGVKAHVEGLKKFGVCDEHRKSYKPIKSFLTD